MISSCELPPVIDEGVRDCAEDYHRSLLSQGRNESDYRNLAIASPLIPQIFKLMETWPASKREN